MAFTPYYQNDKKWENTKIGFSQSLTIGQIGCLLTSMAMTVNYFGGNQTPLSLNERLKASNGFNDAWIKPANVPGMFPQLGFERQKSVECKNSPAPMADIDAGLAAGSVVAVQVDREADATFEAEDGHWVLLYKKEGDDYLMWDPWYSETAAKTLVGRYGFGRKKPEDIIQSAIWHGKGPLPDGSTSPATTTPKPAKPRGTSKPAPQSKPTTVSTTPLAVKSTVSELTLRQQPRVSQTNVLKTVSPRDVLSVIEETGTARGKIGQKNQWLQVRDGQGVEGYVAAWYVQETAVSQTTPPPATPAAKTETAVTVKPTTASLSLRTAPRVADETLITYLSQNSKLTLVDPSDTNKIGQQNQWVQVKTSDGKTGYVAAWYVKKS